MERDRRRPTIFVFTTAYEPFIGGAEIAIREITELLKDEFRFFIFTARFRKDLPKSQEIGGAAVRRIGFGFFPFDKFLLPLLGFFVVWRYARREHPVLFWGVMASFASGIPYLINFTHPLRPIPVVLTLQEGDSIEHIAKAKFGLVGFSWKAALRRTDYLTAISTFLLTLGRDFGYRGERKIIPNGVDISAFEKEFSADELRFLRESLGIDGDEKIIITTSRLVEKNAVDVAVRATAVLVKKKEKVKFLVIGSGEKEQELRHLASSLGIPGDVLFLGSVSHKEIPKYLKIADVFVRPSRSEGFGISFIEAMAAGCAVIGTTAGGISDFLEDERTGLTVKVDDPKDLAEKIEKVLKDPLLREKLIREGREMARNRFQWERVAAEFRTVFDRFKESGTKERLLIATPLFPPSVGGPAIYAESLVRVFSRKGHRVSLLAYGGRGPSQDVPVAAKAVSSSLPMFVKHFSYFIETFRLLLKNDAVIALDPFIVGFPAMLAARLLGKKIVLRIEGDFLWETYIERTGQEITLKKFYETLPCHRLNQKEKTIFWLSKFVVRHADAIVFSSTWRREIFTAVYPVIPAPHIIAPPWPEIRIQKNTREKVILYAGRFVKVKNLARLIRIFLALDGNAFRLELVGDGPEKNSLQRLIQELGAGARVMMRPSLAHEMLVERIASSHAFVLPSFSEVGPNVILDCIHTATPFVCTRETGFYETLKNVGLFAEPLDENDMKEKLRLLFEEEYYREYTRRLRAFPARHSWEEIADEWRGVVSAHTKSKNNVL